MAAAWAVWVAWAAWAAWVAGLGLISPSSSSAQDFGSFFPSPFEVYASPQLFFGTARIMSHGLRQKGNQEL